MATMDIFSDDAFTCVELTRAIETQPFKPQRLGQLGLFTPKPIRTEKFSIERIDGKLQLIQSSERGAPLAQRGRDFRNIRDFRTTRLAKGDVIRAEEIANIRAFGTESELKQVAGEVMRRSMALRDDLELTWERHRLGAVQGIVLDADNSVLYNWYDQWGVAAATEIAFNLSVAGAGTIREKCQQIRRAMARAAKGQMFSGIHALCGDEFFDSLIKNEEVRSTYMGYQAAADLRGAYGPMFPFGGIMFENYQGTDDNSATTGVAVPVDKAKFFPTGAPGLFEVALSPAETFDFVNTPGRPFYGMTIPDQKRNMYVELEVYSYPMHYCTRPEMLQSGRAGA